MMLRRLFGCGCAAVWAAGAAWGAGDGGFDYRHPRPAGYAEPGVPGNGPDIQFRPIDEEAGVLVDLVAQFPHEAVPEFEVAEVAVNGAAHRDFLVRNAGVFNGNRRVHGHEDFTVALYSGWETGQEYRVRVAGRSASGEAVVVEAVAAAPAERNPVKGMAFKPPTGEVPYHHIVVTLAKEAIDGGTVTRVELDGAPDRDFRVFNAGIAEPGKDAGKVGEAYDNRIDGALDAEILVHAPWTNGSKHAVRIVVAGDGGAETVYEAEGSAPGAGGYWNAAWPGYVSLTLHETAGAAREGEPVHATIGVMADDITDPEKEIRVVAYDPRSPKADAAGYVVAPHQILDYKTWRDPMILNHPERDAATGEPIRRYIPTTTVELVFFADVLPYEEKVYQIVYGNAEAEAPSFETALSVSHGAGLSQQVRNEYYDVGLAENSGAVETVLVLGGDEPTLLEHRIETNGAVHWNPGAYSPPTPWVHASDWEGAAYKELTGPLLHRTRSFAYLPHMDSVSASVSYEFYAGKPYVLQNSMMEVHENIFVQALRNGEIVLNHAVVDEFVWKDHFGVVHSLDLSDTELHPIHALELPADVPWIAFISREHNVAFAGIVLSFENINRYGDPVSLAQPYIYIQNGPWYYWSRGLVYPFGGMNFTRMMPVRRGSVYIEKNAWVFTRLGGSNDPFEPIEAVEKRLRNPLLVHEWMPTDPRTPESWIMPLLTMPFDEGVEGAQSAVSIDEEEQGE